ncbi:SAM-dependent methyltransferase [Chloroflexota bacterium]
MLPLLEKPQILDIGCGCGIPTIELARLSQGKVTGIDIDQSALDRFAGRIQEAGLADRVQALYCSMADMDFAPESFNIIWTEGSIYAIGFANGLQEWKRFLTPNGFLVIHDEQGNIREKCDQITCCGYELIGEFRLSTQTWRKEYFIPLEKLVTGYQARVTNNPKVLEEIAQAQGELDMFKENPERNSSVYFVMLKH